MSRYQRSLSFQIVFALVLLCCLLSYYLLLMKMHPDIAVSEPGEPIIHSNVLHDWNICGCSQTEIRGKTAKNVLKSRLTCSDQAAAVKSAVMCEVASHLKNLHQRCSNAAVVPSCKPTLITVTCEMLRKSNLPCSKNFVIEQYDYHTQFHCLHAIAQTLQPHDRSRTAQQAQKVPRLLHQVWFYGPNRTMPFQEYLGFISHLRFFQPEAVFIWNTGHLPTGRWWQEAIAVLNQQQPIIQVPETFNLDGLHIQANRTVFTSQAKVYSIVRSAPSTIYGREIQNMQHKSDIARIESIMLFGGFYADVDTLSLKSLEPLLQYPLTMGREKPNGVGNMMIFGAPMSAYLFLLHASFFDFNKDEWVEHSIEGNHVLATRCPDLIHVEQQSLLTPNFADRQWYFHNTVRLKGSYMVHLYWRYIDNRELRSPDKLIQSNNLISRLFRGIFYGLCSVCE